MGATVIALSNWDAKDPKGIAKDLLGFVDHRLKPLASQSIVDTDLAATALVRKALDGFLAGKMDSTIYGDAMLKALSPEMLKGMAPQLKALGGLQSMTLIKSEEAAGVKTREYRVVFANATLTFQVIIGKTGLIESATMR